MADLTVANHGSILLLRGDTPAGKAWLLEHIASDAQTWHDSIVVEPRYIDDIVCGAIIDGLEVGDVE
jgi:hypothetical protein